MPRNLGFSGPVIIIAGFFLLFGLEALFSLRKRKRRRSRRLVVNLTLGAMVFGVGGVIVRPLAFWGANWAQTQAFGLLPWIGLPGWAQWGLGFLLMDLTFYYWHRANHVYPLLWRFHNVHHVDPDLDVSTSFRFHFIEILYSSVFRILQVILIGISPFIYLTYELGFSLATMFHHSNLSLPIRWERWLNKVIVTPRMHGVHHSVIGSETNSNYSVIFKWWDLWHRTLRLNVSQADIIIGVPGYLLPPDNHFWSLMTIPFKKQRSYWRWPSGKVPVRQPNGSNPKIMLE